MATEVNLEAVLRMMAIGIRKDHFVVKTELNWRKGD
jgi:hypothetical protein